MPAPKIVKLNNSFMLRTPKYLFFLCVAFSAHAEILHVPSEFPDVDAAFAASTSGDTILLAQGEYEAGQTVPNSELTVASGFIFSHDTLDALQCVLRAPEEGGRCLLSAEEPANTRLALIGLTFKSDVSESGQTKGGLTLSYRNVSIQGCIFDSSYAGQGGAIYADNCSLQLIGCRFHAVGAASDGMAIYARDCTLQIDDGIIDYCYSAPQDWNESVFCIERGEAILSGFTLTNVGWATTPGSHGITAKGVVSQLTMTGCNIVRNRFHTFFMLPGDGVDMPSNIRCDSNTVVNNEFQFDFFNSSYADTGSIVRFRGNFFGGNSRLSEGMFINRMFFTVYGNYIIADISGNRFENNECQENSVASFGSIGPANLRFQNNTMIHNSSDGFANPPGGAVVAINVQANAISHSSFINSDGYAVHHGISSSPPSYVFNCYWGDSTGPLHQIENPQGQGDSVHIRVSVTPWSPDSLFTPSSVGTSLPITFAIGYPYPNPFNSTVTIEYALTRGQDVKLEIFDVLGRQVETLLSEHQSIGVHSVKWTADNFASGLYFAKLSTPAGPSQTVKLLLMK